MTKLFPVFNVNNRKSYTSLDPHTEHLTDWPRIAGRAEPPKNCLETPEY